MKQTSNNKLDVTYMLQNINPFIFSLLHICYMEKKYSVDDFKALTNEERRLLVLIAVANELHNIYTVLYKMPD